MGNLIENPPEWLGPREVAEVLGVTKATATNLILRGDIKARRFGRLIKIDPADLQEYLDSSTGHVAEPVTSRLEPKRTTKTQLKKKLKGMRKEKNAKG